MSKRYGVVFGVFVALACGSPGHSQRPAAREETFAQRVARLAGVTERQADQVLRALGPAVQEELRTGRPVPLGNVGAAVIGDLQKGNAVAFDGLGTFRVVRIPAYRDMGLNDTRNARPFTVPASNRVEFLPNGLALGAVNEENVTPNDTVRPFEYKTLPNQTPGQKTGRTRSGSTRVP